MPPSPPGANALARDIAGARTPRPPGCASGDLFMAPAEGRSTETIFLRPRIKQTSGVQAKMRQSTPGCDGHHSARTGPPVPSFVSAAIKASGGRKGETDMGVVETILIAFIATNTVLGVSSLFTLAR